MHKRRQFSTFQSYLKDRERRIRRLVAAIEKQGAQEALDICRLLVDQINRDLRGKKFGRFVNDVSSLADFQVSIERAAALLDGIAAYGENQRPVDAAIVRLGHAASVGSRSAALLQGYSTTGYLDRRAYWRLAHLQRGGGAAVPGQAISVCDSCSAQWGDLSLYPAQQVVTKSDSFPLTQRLA
jgi:hypothetical protein